MTPPSSRSAYDAAAAKAGLEKAGIKKVHMITYSNPRPYNAATGAALAAAIQGYLQKVGVEATIDTFDWTTYKDKVKAGDYDIAFYGWIGDNGDPDNFMNLLADKDPNLNIARWQDPAYIDMIKKALATPNGPDRDAQYAAMEKYVAERSVWLPISHAKTQAAYRPNVVGLRVPRDGQRVPVQRSEAVVSGRTRSLRAAGSHPAWFPAVRSLTDKRVRLHAQVRDQEDPDGHPGHDRGVHHRLRLDAGLLARPRADRARSARDAGADRQVAGGQRPRTSRS